LFAVVVIAAYGLGQILAACSSKPPPSGLPPAARPPAPPVRQPDALIPLLLGLALGWWLGRGPGDGQR
jgi:hypothetical protein